MKESVKGTLTHIRFQRDGFLIGTFASDEHDDVTCLGSILKPEIGTEYELFGRWADDPKWGRQFRFSSFGKAELKGDEAVIRYLSQTAKWVQKRTAAKIVEAFGEKTLEVLRKNPERVAREIKGVSLAKALEIQADLQANEAIEKALVEVEALVGGKGLRKSLVTEVVAKWGSDAPTILRDNPFRLAEFHGIGFQSADTVALAMGYDRKSIHRQVAAVLHLLHKNVSNGHTWLLERDLAAGGLELIGCPPTKGLEQAIEEGSVVSVENFLALRSVALNELYIAQKIEQLTTWNFSDTANHLN